MGVLEKSGGGGGRVEDVHVTSTKIWCAFVSRQDQPEWIINAVWYRLSCICCREENQASVTSAPWHGDDRNATANRCWRMPVCLPQSGHGVQPVDRCNWTDRWHVCGNQEMMAETTWIMWPAPQTPPPSTDNQWHLGTKKRLSKRLWFIPPWLFYTFKLLN